MKFTRKRAVSPIIATLLLIAIAVAAGIIVYVFVNSIAGSLTGGGGAQTAERLQMQSYNFALNPATCSCSGQILDLFLLNSGSGTSTISAVYFDGTLQTLAPASTTDAALATNDAFYTTSAALIQDFTTATCTATAGTTQEVCSTVAGTAGTSGSGQVYNAGATGQLFLEFASANTPTPGTAHTVKVVTVTGATFVYSVSAGRTG